MSFTGKISLTIINEMMMEMMMVMMATMILVVVLIVMAITPDTSSSYQEVG